MTPDHFLVPLDVSGCAEEVVGACADLCGRLGAQVTLLSVVDLLAGLPEDTHLAANPMHREGTVAQLAAEDAKAGLMPFVHILEHAGVTARPLVDRGDPALTILRIAEEEGITHILMGTHGRKGLRRALLGSVAERVLRQATCPVTVVRSMSQGVHPGPSAVQQSLRDELQDG